MNRALVFGAPLLLLWAAAVGKLAALRRDPRNPARWAYWLALVALALGLTVLRPPWVASVDSTMQVRTVGRVFGHSLVLASACAVQAFLAYSIYPTALARRRIHRRGLVLTATITLLAALFGVSRLQHRTMDFPVHHGLAVATTDLYWLAFVGYLAWMLLDMVRLNWHWANLTDQAVLQLGLRLTAAGATAGLGYVGCLVLDVAASQLGLTHRFVSEILPLQIVLSACILLIVIGTTMPAWGPRVGLPKLLRRVGQYRAHRRLYPLWRALCQAVPDIALAPPAGVWRDRLRARRLEFWLHRRVLEIRDARLALRPYFDPQVAQTTAALGRQAGLDGEDLHAAVEAASLAAAVHAKAHEQPAAADWVSAAAVGGTELAADLESESAWLMKVAAAYAHSPLVRALVAQR
jgi:hypothetical protein